MLTPARPCAHPSARHRRWPWVRLRGGRCWVACLLLAGDRLRACCLLVIRHDWQFMRGTRISQGYPDPLCISLPAGVRAAREQEPFARDQQRLAELQVGAGGRGWSFKGGFQVLSDALP